MDGDGGTDLVPGDDNAVPVNAQLGRLFSHVLDGGIGIKLQTGLGRRASLVVNAAI